MTEIKTAEEIYYDLKEKNSRTGASPDAIALAAMQEYANQFKSQSLPVENKNKYKEHEDELWNDIALIGVPSMKAISIMKEHFSIARKNQDQSLPISNVIDKMINQVTLQIQQQKLGTAKELYDIKTLEGCLIMLNDNKGIPVDSNVGKGKIDFNQTYDLKGLLDEEKQKFINAVTEPCTKVLMNVFISCGIENFIEQMAINQYDSKEYVLTFQTKESFLKRFKGNQPVDSNVEDSEIEKIAKDYVQKNMGDLYNEEGFDTFKNIEFFTDGYKIALQSNKSNTISKDVDEAAEKLYPETSKAIYEITKRQMANIERQAFKEGAKWYASKHEAAVEEISVKFFYWWYNQKGSNTIEGFKSFKEADIYKEWYASQLNRTEK